MQILTSWGIKEGLGRVNGGSSSDFSSFRVSGADHLLFLVAVGLLGSVLVSRDAAGNPILSGNFSSPFSDDIFAFPWSIPFSCSAYLCLLPVRLSFLECFSKMLAESMGWPFLMEPFFRFLSVSDMQTSPTESLEHGKSKSWLVLSGQQDDQPCPNTKNGYSTKTSTLTCKEERERRGRGTWIWKHLLAYPFYYRTLKVLCFHSKSLDPWLSNWMGTFLRICWWLLGKGQTHTSVRLWVATAIPKKQQFNANDCLYLLLI